MKHVTYFSQCRDVSSMFNTQSGSKSCPVAVLCNDTLSRWINWRSRSSVTDASPIVLRVDFRTVISEAWRRTKDPSQPSLGRLSFQAVTLCRAFSQWLTKSFRSSSSMENPRSEFRRINCKQRKCRIQEIKHHPKLKWRSMHIWKYDKYRIWNSKTKIKIQQFWHSTWNNYPN